MIYSDEKQQPPEAGAALKRGTGTTGSPSDTRRLNVRESVTFMG
jgi:hypothetical protein